MTFVSIILISMTTVSSLIVIWSCICATNLMASTTRWAVRGAHILLGVGACAVLLAPGYLGRNPSWAEALMISGLALLSIADKRRRFTRRLLRSTYHR